MMYLSKWRNASSWKTIGAAFCLLAISNATLYAQTQGTIDVKITLTDSCLIDSNPMTGSVNFGTLDFGTQPTLFTSTRAELNGGVGFTVECSATTAPEFSITQGVNDANADVTAHAMAFNGQYIDYNVFTDPAYTTPTVNNTPFFISANDGSVEPVMLYAEAIGDPIAGYDPGVYTDILTINVDF